MSRVIVEYMPRISPEGRRNIGDNVSHSMESHDGETFQYAIEQCIEALAGYGEDDYVLLKELEGDGVHFIEL